jgi:hypothetical protein
VFIFSGIGLKHHWPGDAQIKPSPPNISPSSLFCSSSPFCAPAEAIGSLSPFSLHTSSRRRQPLFAALAALASEPRGVRAGLGTGEGLREFANAHAKHHTSVAAAMAIKATPVNPRSDATASAAASASTAAPAAKQRGFASFSIVFS